MKKFRVKIKSVSPLLVHKFTGDGELTDVRPAKREDKTPREIAESYCYRDKAGYLRGLSAWVTGSFLDACSSFKQKGTRKSLKWAASGSFLPEGIDDVDTTPILVNGKKTKNFEIDSRPVVNKNTRGRIMCHRPKFEDWELEYFINIDDEVLNPKQCHEILNVAGRRCGIGAFRPNRMGPFGRYQVSLWEEVN